MYFPRLLTSLLCFSATGSSYPHSRGSSPHNAPRFDAIEHPTLATSSILADFSTPSSILSSATPTVLKTPSASASASAASTPGTASHAASVFASTVPDITLASKSASSNSISMSTHFTISSSSVFSLTSSSQTSAAPTPSVDPKALEDMATVLQRRQSFITASATNASSISSWLSSLDSDGKWPDSEITYTAGCAAQRANWPAGDHWIRILTMSAAWHGGLEGAEQWVQDPDLGQAISSAMSWWFVRDFTIPGCLDEGNSDTCPCGTPGLWNSNWFSNVILVPRLVGESCLLFNAFLTADQLSSCKTMTARSYNTFYEGNKGYLSGANILDVAKIGIDLSLLTTNLTLIKEAYGRIHNEVFVQPRSGSPTDGIQSDGAFDQHSGLLYNGNYGKDYSNDVLELEIDAGETQFAADQYSQKAFETLIEGDQWMIILNKLTGVLHWDLSALPRFISFPVADAQATGSLNLNLTEIQELGQLWQSSTMTDVYDRLINPGNTANAGSLNGNRFFSSNDYMVQRGKGYVTTLKMYSSRTKNTECTNSQNPLGFHLADGAQYTYLKGNEYEDIAAAWDWNLIPGITVDSNNTALRCDDASHSGIENFVGGVSDGKVGAAAMRYTNPLTKALSWQKAWFFLGDDIQYVMISNISASSGSPVLSVLDQRRHDGDIYVNDKYVSSSGQSSHSFTSTLWHGNMGYKFDNAYTELSLSVGEKTGNWSKIGTSTQPPTTVDLYAAWLEHKNLLASVSYLAFPATDFKTFQKKRSARDIRLVRNDAHLMAAYDADNDTIFSIFWDEAGGSVYLLRSLFQGPSTISTSGNVALIYNMKSDEMTVSDPSQTLSSVNIEVTSGWLGQKRSTAIVLPSGDAAGRSVTHIF